jgi:hypothetical protein
MKRRHEKAAAVAIAMAFVLGTCGAGVYWVTTWFPSLGPLPPLLEGASSRGEMDGCRDIVTGVSPQLDERLRDQFPPGSSETALVSALKDQGFDAPAPCRGNPLMRSSGFSRSAKPEQRPIMTASVYWRVDDADKIVWTHGFVFFYSL